MDQNEAIALIKEGVPQDALNWADIGAGNGTFTLALREILPQAEIIAVDKNIHALYRQQRNTPNAYQIMEGDFTKELDLPLLDGMIMANALHYAKDPVNVLKQLLGHLKPQGTFILIEYDIKKPVKPWIPYPIPLRQFQEIALKVGLNSPQLIGMKPSVYGRGNIYASYSHKK